MALMLQEAGGPGSLDVSTVKLALENSVQPRTSTPETTQALGASSAGFVSITSIGQRYFGPNYFTVNYFGSAGNAIANLTIDGSSAGLVFDTTAFAIGLSATDVQIEPVSSATSKFTLKFKPGSFQSGNSISFTLGQDVAGTFAGFTQDQFGVGSEAEDLGSGATFTANFAGNPKASVRAAFQNGPLTSGYSPFDGFGLIDAIAAVEGVSSSSQRLSKQ